MKIHRSDQEPEQEEQGLASLARQRRVHEMGKSVDLLIALLDKLCPSVFLHLTVISESGGGVSVSRVNDNLPDDIRSNVENLNSIFAKDLARVFGGESSCVQTVGPSFSDLIDTLKPQE